MNALLHEERIARVPLLGRALRRTLLARINEALKATGPAEDPDVTVLIRTRNDGKRLESLIEDIKAQEFTGQVQLVVVDTESADETLGIARRHGATLVSITQEGFNYPKALNLGFARAKHDLVLCLVGHSNLCSRYALRAATRHALADPRFGGAYSFGLPDANATHIERFVNAVAILKLLKKPAAPERGPRMGLLAGNDSLVSKKVWKELGGYDESFAAGGEDSELGKQMLLRGYRVYWEPALSIYHSHGLGLVNLWRQMAEWRRLGQPHPFDHERLKNYGRDFS